MAMVARDHSGNVIRCATRLFQKLGAVLHAELLAIRFGLEMALYSNLTNLVKKQIRFK
ncbi:hypothetical protein PTKIN_Ptkin05aG0160200 [Pterospermum kingtungense]